MAAAATVVAHASARPQARQLLGGGFTLGHSQAGYQQSSGYQQNSGFGSSGYGLGGGGGGGQGFGFGAGLPYGGQGYGFGGGLPYGGGYNNNNYQQGSGYAQSSGGYSQGGLSAGFGLWRR